MAFKIRSLFKRKVKDNNAKDLDGGGGGDDSIPPMVASTYPDGCGESNSTNDGGKKGGAASSSSSSSSLEDDNVLPPDPDGYYVRNIPREKSAKAKNRSLDGVPIITSQDADVFNPSAVSSRTNYATGGFYSKSKTSYVGKERPTVRPSAKTSAFGGAPRYDWMDIVSFSNHFTGRWLCIGILISFVIRRTGHPILAWISPSFIPRGAIPLNI